MFIKTKTLLNSNFIYYEKSILPSGHYVIYIFFFILFFLIFFFDNENRGLIHINRFEFDILWKKYYT